MLQLGAEILYAVRGARHGHKAGFDDEEGGHAGPLGDQAGPHHGGSAAPSEADAGEYGVDAILFEFGWKRRDHLAFIPIVRQAKLLKLDDLHVLVATLQFFTQNGEPLPRVDILELGDGLSVEIAEALGELQILLHLFAERPYGFEDGTVA